MIPVSFGPIQSEKIISVQAVGGDEVGIPSSMAGRQDHDSKPSLFMKRAPQHASKCRTVAFQGPRQVVNVHYVAQITMYNSVS